MAWQPWPPPPSIPSDLTTHLAYSASLSLCSRSTNFLQSIASLSNFHYCWTKMEKEMMARSFISSAAYAPSLLSPSRNSLNFGSLSPLKVNPQRCVVVGTKPFCGVVAASWKLESTSVPTSVPVRVALELLQAGHRYLDVRTPEEFSAGHAPGATNVPYLLRLGSGMARNPKFLEEVSSHFRKDDEIIVGCQKGKRSLMAVNDLLAAGYTAITDIAGGYDAWSQSGLPTE